MTRTQSFRCERLDKRRYITKWSDGATFFHRTFKDAKLRHDQIAATLPPGQALVAVFVGCPIITAEESK